MRSDHIGKERLERFRDRRLERAEIAPVVLHLSRCRDCMEEYRTMFPEVVETVHNRAFIPEAEVSETEFHLSYAEHLEPYIEGTISEIDREIVEGHIRTCGHCAGMLRDLQEFQETLSIRHPHGTPVKRSFLERLYAAASFRPMALAFSVIFILGASAILIWYQSSYLNQPEIAKTDVAVPEPLRSSANNPEAPSTEPLVTAQTPPQAITETEITPLKVPRFLAGLKLTPPGPLRGSSTQAIVVTSGNGIAVRGFARLSWRPVEGINSYEISIFDANDERISGADAVIGTTWLSRGLTKGKIYRWQVSADPAEKSSDDHDRHIGQGSFYLISSAEEARIDAARDPISRGRAMAEAGMINEAVTEFRRAVRTDFQPTVAKAYLRQLGFSE